VELQQLKAIDLSDTPFKRLSISTIDSSVLPVVVVSEAELHIIGTAFSVGIAGLLITARHVAEEALSLCGEIQDSWVATVYTVPGHDSTGTSQIFTNLTHASTVHYHPEFDLAVMISRWDHNGVIVPLPGLALDCTLPLSGERLLALGYIRATIKRESNEAGSITYEIEQSLVASEGHVTQLYPNGRDSGMLPFPCFETSVRMDPGMSGGPVISGVTGGVCGVVCSGLQEDAQRTFVSFASVAGLILGLEDPSQEPPLHLYEHARSGQIHLTRPINDVTFESRGDDGWSLVFPTR
jgi:hypothetical protein